MGEEVETKGNGVAMTRWDSRPHSALSGGAPRVLEKGSCAHHTFLMATVSRIKEVSCDREVSCNRVGC